MSDRLEFCGSSHVIFSLSIAKEANQMNAAE